MGTKRIKDLDVAEVSEINSSTKLLCTTGINQINKNINTTDLIENSLSSTNEYRALSAASGKIINDALTSLTSDVSLQLGSLGDQVASIDSRVSIVEGIYPIDVELIQDGYFLSSSGTGTAVFKAPVNNLSYDGAIPDVLDARVGPQIESMFDDVYTAIADVSTLPAELTQVSSNDIQVDFSKGITIINDTAGGTGGATINTFVNMQTKPTICYAIYRHSRESAVDVTLQSGPIIVGDNTYTFTNIDDSMVSVLPNKTLLIAYITIQNYTNAFEVIVKYDLQS